MMQNNSILTPTSSSSATPGTRFLVRATSFARQALQAQQKRMESPDVVAQNADVAAEDACSGGTALDMNQLAREALVILLLPFSRGERAVLFPCPPRHRLLTSLVIRPSPPACVCCSRPAAALAKCAQLGSACLRVRTRRARVGVVCRRCHRSLP